MPRTATVPSGSRPTRSRRTRSRLGPGAGLLLAAGAAALGLSACSSEATLEQQEAETQISAALEEQVGQAPDDVSCPSDMPAEVGEEMRCELTADGVTYGLTITISEVDGSDVKFDIEVDDEPTE